MSHKLKAENGLDIWRSLRTGLVISCQASAGTAMARPDFIAAQARTVEQAGAVAIRAEGLENIRAVMDAVSVPIIGLIKEAQPGSDVYITPTVEHVLALANLGVEIIAVDATSRPRWYGQSLESFYEQVRDQCDVQLLADIDTLESAQRAVDLGFDAIATTLSGYTAQSQTSLPNIELISQIARMTDKPIMAEGGFQNPAQVHDALQAGAWTVCIGTAITNPYLMTQKFIAESR